MPGHARGALHIKHALRWDLFPLRNGLGGYFLVQGTRKARIAFNGPFGLVQGGSFQFVYTAEIVHPALKAQLSTNCKHLFR